MTITIVNGGGAFNTTNNAEKTAVATPPVGALIVVTVGKTGSTGILGISDDNPDGFGSSYNAFLSSLKATSADLMSVFIRNHLIGVSTPTNFTTTGMAPTSTGGGPEVAWITGMAHAGISAVRRSGNQNNGASGAIPSVVLGSAALTTNPLLGYLFNATNGILTAGPSGWTSFVADGYATPAAGIRGTNIVSGFAGGATITWGGTSASAFCAYAIEFDGSQPSPPIENPRRGRKNPLILRFEALKNSGIVVPKLWMPEPHPLAV